jgi:hypothetical protein
VNLQQSEQDRIAANLGFIVYFGFALSIAAFEILDRSNPLRWLAYAVPPAGFIAAIAIGRVRVSPALALAYLFVFVFTLSCLANLDDLQASYAARDLIIYALLLMTLALRLPLTSWQLFLSMCCTFILVFIFMIAHTTLSVSLHYDPDVIRGESTASIVYGALALFFLINRRWAFAVAALVFAVYTFKRTSYVYFVIAGGLWVMAELTIAVFGARYRRSILVAITSALFFACLLLSYYLLEALSYVQQTYFPERQLHELTTGRSPLYEAIQNALRRADPVHLLFGYGPGSVEKLGLETVDIALAHNEFYHHLYDYGVLGIVFLYAMLLALLNMRPRYYPIIFYLILVSLTDNPIYVFLIAIPILCVFSLDIDEKASTESASVKVLGRSLPVRT